MVTHDLIVLGILIYCSSANCIRLDRFSAHVKIFILLPKVIKKIKTPIIARGLGKN